jgi:hypothetical protein
MQQSSSSHHTRLGMTTLLLAVAGVPNLARPASAQCGPGWTQRTPSTLPPGRVNHAMAYDSVRGRTVLFGGFQTSPSVAILGDTWEWDGVTWAQQTPAVSPPPRRKHAMAFDSARGVTVLFGGAYGGPTYSDTWEWNGAEWTERQPAIVPALREYHAMAYDSIRGVTVLFGGRTGSSTSTALDDTWEWDGSAWTQRTPAVSPPARFAHALAYDSHRGVTVLFGGLSDTNAYLGDTWEWDGTTWVQRSPANSPSPREGHAMAYDSLLGVAVLFGGEFNGVRYSDTWEWDGAAWVLRTLTATPPGRYQHAMAYDSGRGLTVLFGGANSATSDDTWEYQITVAQLLQEPVDTAVAEGSDAGFGVTALGTSALSFQWRKDGTPIPGAVHAFLRIPAVKRADAGAYDVLIGGPCGQFVSAPATLTVHAPADFDGDRDVDLADFLVFQACFNGPNRPPACQ